MEVKGRTEEDNIHSTVTMSQMTNVYDVRTSHRKLLGGGRRPEKPEKNDDLVSSTSFLPKKPYI